MLPFLASVDAFANTFDRCVRAFMEVETQKRVSRACVPI